MMRDPPTPPFPISIASLMTAIPRISPRLAAFAFATLLVISGTAIWYLHGANDHPTWTHELPGKGVVSSIAAGLSVDGTELVVVGGYAVKDGTGEDLRLLALESASGHVRWEHRQARGIAPYMNKEPRIAFDADGHILAGWQYTAVGRGDEASLEKLSSTDGSILWEWRLNVSGQGARRPGSGQVALPSAISRDHVWVSGIASKGDQTYDRFLALLESATGREKWLVFNNQARDAFAQPARIFPLGVTDAIVFSPPQKHERSYPWILQRVDETNGTEIWRVELTRDNERSLPDVHCLVDEVGGEVLVFWQEVIGGRWKGELIRYDADTGLEVARRPSPFPDILSGGVYGAALGEAGEVHLWGRKEIERTHVNWLNWSYDPDLTIPLPESRTFWHVHPVRLTLSSSDGRVLSENRLSADESPTTVWNDPATGQPAVMFVRSMRKRAQVEPWRTLRLDGRVGLPTASGPASSLHYPAVAAVTPSGRIVTTGDPLEEKLFWSIRLW